MPDIKIFDLCLIFANLTIWLFGKGGHFGSLQSLVSSGGSSKKPAAKIGDFALRKKRREKTRMAKRAQKSVTKKKKVIFNVKIFKYEYLCCINLVLYCAVSSEICPNQLFLHI